VDRILVGLLLLAAMLPALAADVYRWTDKEGKVHYSDTPPPGNPAARPLDLPDAKPGAPDIVIEPRAEPPAQPPAAAAPRVEERGEERAVAAVPAYRGMSFDTYIMLRQGMSEGELLQRAGAPDYESADGTVGTTVRRGRRVETFSNLEFKKFYYYPTTSDPFTTVVTITGGYISDLTRTRQF
jgi:hypothetical protein